MLGAYKPVPVTEIWGMFKPNTPRTAARKTAERALREANEKARRKANEEARRQKAKANAEAAAAKRKANAEAANARRKANEAAAAKRKANQAAATATKKVIQARRVNARNEEVLRNARKKVNSKQWQNNASAAYNLYALIPSGTLYSKRSWINSVANAHVAHALRKAKSKRAGMGGTGRRHSLPGEVNHVSSWNRQRMTNNYNRRLRAALNKLEI